MIKLAANISKKVPLPGIDYSSQSYGASMEVEVSDSDKPEIIKERISELYSLLSQTIDEQIAAGCSASGVANGNGGRPQPALAAPSRQNGTPVNRIAGQVTQKPAAGTYRSNGNGNGNGNGGTKSLTATPALTTNNAARGFFRSC
ncbi:MAG TPA: hypothetical protein VKX17_06985 [Planctomycetota bacterium]|nr:hypothetical protein [Planctomycetota bacterium]